MYPDWAVLIGLAVVLIWLGLLTYLILRERSFFKSLFPKSGERDIRHKFSEVLNSISEFDSKLTGLEKELDEFGKKNLGDIQKIKLFRYNPYQDTGGDISFSIALLDGNNNGVVITSLHGRAGTRIFAKNIEKGKSNQQLSNEEEIVVKEAINS